MLYITGVGLVTKSYETYAELLGKEVSELALFEPETEAIAYQRDDLPFRYGSRVAREDRSILNDYSKLALDATAQAVEMADSSLPFTAEERQTCTVYTAAESVELRPAALHSLLKSQGGSLDQCFEALGEIKRYLNPLDMLRLLSTNTLYHISKAFQFRGGGYPVHRMSLAGLVAVEAAFDQLHDSGHGGAIVTAVGDMTKPENLSAFKKMGLLRLAGIDGGVIPNFGAASLFIEHESSLSRTPHAELLAVYSHYAPTASVHLALWKTLFKKIAAEREFDRLHVISYANGILAQRRAELAAITEFWPAAIIHEYKPYIGYTGRANTLIDVAFSLADRTIEPGAHILVNGVGINSGVGSILLRKSQK